MNKTVDRNVYLVVTDLHLVNTEKQNRISYEKEIDLVWSKITELVNKYRQQGLNVVVIFLGDLYDRSYKSIKKACYDTGRFTLLSRYAKLYSVVGNHEFTFYKDNPFWTLFRDIQSDKVKRRKKSTWKPEGFYNVITVCDGIQDGNVVLHFNHHDCPINKVIPNKINIGLFHCDLYNEAILEAMDTTYDANIFRTQYVDIDSGVLQGYDYAYLGHHHKIYMSYKIKHADGSSTECHNLASLNRPNVEEVNDKMLERNIPAIVVEGGNLLKIEDNTFNLLSRSECVKEQVVERQKEVYKRNKKRKEYRISTISANQTPVQAIQEYLIDTPAELELVNSLLSKSNTEYDDEIHETCFKLGLHLDF